MQYTKVTRFVALSVVAAIAAVVAGELFSSNLLPAGTASAADNPQVYKSVFLEKCSACHNAPDPTVTQNTQEEWRTTVHRMLTRNGASASISPTEADEIVEYLGLFPPRAEPGANGPLSTRAADVWTEPPSNSLVFTFSSGNQLKSFASQHGAWGILTTAPADNSSRGRPYLLQARPTPADSAILMETKDPAVGDLDMQIQFRFMPDSTAQIIGFLMSATDARDCYVVRLDAVKSELAIIEETDGHFTVAGTAPTGALSTPSVGWHTLRAIYHNDTRTLTVWVDSTKKAVTNLAHWSDNAQFGLMTQGVTTAGFRNFTVDMYPSAQPAS